MAESKFSGALARLKRPQEQEPQNVAPPPAPPVAPRRENAIAVRGRGRPAGKRSDPEFKPTTLILRETTTETTRRNLKDRKTGLDLSELVEKLLSDWNGEGN